jgi:release factor glutamine methyltransferase
MPVSPDPRSPDPPSEAAIVATLRGAGCVFAEDEARLLIAAARDPDELADMVRRRASGLPLEHVLGWVEFGGLRIAVAPGVFVPRRRTEFLVDRAVSVAPRGRRAVIVDMCCGSGAMGVALASVLHDVDLHSVDIDPVAVRCARRNVEPLGGHVYEGDLEEPLPTALLGHVDVLVANAPYVPSEALRLLPPEARVHEPRLALDGGADGLDIVRRVVAAAGRWLAPGGHVLFETSERQAPIAVDVVARNGLAPSVARSDELGATVVLGRR